MSKIVPSDLNDLFAKLEVIRQEHRSANGLTADQQNALNTAYDTTPAETGEKISNNIITQLNNNITNLQNSPYIENTFSAQIPIPSVGQLLLASSLANINNVVNDIDAACPNCAYFSAHFTSATSQGNFTSAASQGNFGANFTTASSQGNFTSASSQGNFGANFTTASSQGNFTSASSEGNFSNFTSSAQKGNFANFTSASSQGNFGSNFGSNFISSSQEGNFVNFTSSSQKGNFSNFTSSSQKGFSNFSRFTTSSGFKLSMGLN